MNELATMPRCGHKQPVDDCISCLAHRLDTIRHLQAVLKRHRDKPRVVINVTAIPGRVKPKKGVK